ncbi:hypothetical protein BC827DRAFT_1239677 [Russula dissimulans]|nr:hypothetical protein BC827DRAFT_1239677 [Russula dissimulans]
MGVRLSPWFAVVNSAGAQNAIQLRGPRCARWQRHPTAHPVVAFDVNASGLDLALLTIVTGPTSWNDRYTVNHYLHHTLYDTCRPVAFSNMTTNGALPSQVLLSSTQANDFVTSLSSSSYTTNRQNLIFCGRNLSPFFVTTFNERCDDMVF